MSQLSKAKQIYINEMVSSQIRPIKGKDIVAFTSTEGVYEPKGFVFAFYLQAVGNQNTIGTPSREKFKSGKHIKVWIDSDVIDAMTAISLFQHIKNIGIFRKWSMGTLAREQLSIPILYNLFRNEIKLTPVIQQKNDEDSYS